ncbi:hypothetical protein E2C01_061591 [Portunus trituberculatus]|uniref:Uncharacterized protein n=1 Tax=Portunus trituberculatus TaxID=210409 RepID=A0A5B7HBN9_PORTR|nr:hypothetical protein [Portunus trituberculatus]
MAYCSTSQRVGTAAQPAAAPRPAECCGCRHACSGRGGARCVEVLEALWVVEQKLREKTSWARRGQGASLRAQRCGTKPSRAYNTDG